MADDCTCYTHRDALRTACGSNLPSTQVCVHLDGHIPAGEAGLLLWTDGLSLTLSVAAVSPADAISCYSAWGERHPSVANSIWWSHIKVSFSLSLLSSSVRGSAAKHQMLTSQDKVCVFGVCAEGPVGAQFEILCFMLYLFLFSKLCSSPTYLSIFLPTYCICLFFAFPFFVCCLFVSLRRSEELNMAVAGHGEIKKCWFFFPFGEKSRGNMSNYVCVKNVLFFLSLPLITTSIAIPT